MCKTKALVTDLDVIYGGLLASSPADGELSRRKGIGRNVDGAALSRIGNDEG